MQQESHRLTITFINHACVLIETDETALLMDPWVEGTAFNDGWCLLDTTTSNRAVIDHLETIGKPVWIWYSHEHSDHLSMPFLRALKDCAALNPRILYQKTIDGRVAKVLRMHGWHVDELAAGKVFELAPRVSITVSPFHDSGDSYALVRAGGRSILNINDCAVDSAQKCEGVLAGVHAKPGEVDVLLTQFGYANWIGNEADIEDRRRAASEKVDRVALQYDHMQPKVIVPFASFTRFCHQDNVYLNDAQNTVDALLGSPKLEAFRDRCLVMKPWDSVEINDDDASVPERTQVASAYWRALASVEPSVVSRGEPVAIEHLEAAASGFLKAMDRNFGWLNRFAERLGAIKPVRIHLVDLNVTYVISYLRGLVKSYDEAWDVAMASPAFAFTLKNEFGFNTLLVNGRFRTAGASAYQKMWRFFILQDVKKMGFGLTSPVITARLIWRNAKKFWARRQAR